MDTATCIVAIRQNDVTYIGGDSAATNDKNLFSNLRKDPKVFQRIESDITWQFGFTSSYRMGQLIRYKLEIPAIESETDDDMLGYMVKKFIPNLQKCLMEGGFQEKEKEILKGGDFIVAVKEYIFEIQGNYQVAVHEENYCAVGCGAQIALGAMYATQHEFDPEKRIRTALEAAERFSAGVRSPFIILHD